MTIVAGLLVLAIVLGGCALPLTIVPEKGQDAEQVARDQRECEAEMQEGIRYAAMAGKALGMSAIGTVVGGVAGAIVGLGVGVGLATTPPIDRHPEVIVVGAAFGFAAVGAVAGAVLGPKKAVADERDVMAKAFQRCMEERGYTVWRDHRPPTS
jgi:hypothetical protein